MENQQNGGGHLAELQALNGEELSRMLSEATVIKVARGCCSADVYRLEQADGRAILLKSYARRPWLLRVLVTRWLLRHELAMLRLLQRLLPGTAPEPYGLLGEDTLAEEFVTAAVPLRGRKHYTAETLPPQAFFAEFAVMMTRLHEAGIAHGDVRRANLLMTATGHPRLIDVATAWYAPSNAGWLRRTVFRILRRSDDFSLAGMIRSYYPDWRHEWVDGLQAKAPWYLRLGRFLRQKVYRRMRRKN